MKREQFSLLIQPFKNKILPIQDVKTAINSFFDIIILITNKFPQLRLNLLLPAYLLEIGDPLKLAQIRNLCSRNIVEILCEGYTEPFLSISPRQLSIRNIKYGIDIVEELTGKKPSGFYPPFSNWEPSFVEELCKLGFSYIALSNDILPEYTRNFCGYWTTEYNGSIIPIIGTNILKDEVGVVSILQEIYRNNEKNSVAPFGVIHLLLPLHKDKIEEATLRIVNISEEIDKYILNLQPILITDYITSSYSEGLLYLSPSLRVKELKDDKDFFLNRLFTYDSVGILHRRLHDTYQRVTTEGITEKESHSFYKSLLFLQDINRFLPAKEEYGFQNREEREYLYRRFIALNIKLHSKKKSKESSVRITDFLKNRRKVINLTNKNIEIIIDPYIGGQIISLDFKRSLLNLCSVYNPTVKNIAGIVVPEISRNWFIDRILPPNVSEWDYLRENNAGLSDFHKRYFGYKIRKTSKGVNVNFNYSGAFTDGEKPLPIHLEKVLGIENTSPDIIFVYQINNPSLVNYNFTFATELFIYLPGITLGEVNLLALNNNYQKIGLQFLRLPSITEFIIEDKFSGIKLHFYIQKEFSLWCLPSSEDKQFLDGLRLIIAFPIKLESTLHYKIAGKLHLGLHKRIKFGRIEKDVL